MALFLDNLPPYLNRDAIINTNVYGVLVIPHERHCDRLLAQLDSYENYDLSYPEGSLYWRELHEVTVLEPEPHRVAAWVYMGNPRFVAPEYPLIESGDWAKYCEERLCKRRLYRMSFCSG